MIPEPRCIDGIKFKLGRSDKKGYDKVLDVYEDLALVFLNALYYNEEGSQIAKDASFLKACRIILCDVSFLINGIEYA